MKSTKSTKPIKSIVANEVQRQLATNANDIRRGQLFGSSNLGYFLTGGYHGADRKRDVWDVAGYPEVLEFDNHWQMWRRHGIAKSVVALKVKKTWQDLPTITDGEKEAGDDSKTAFEKDVDKLIKKHKLFSRLKAMDLRQRVGRYSGLIILAKEPMSGKPSAEEQIRAGGVDSIIKFVPVFESQIIVNPSHIISEITDPHYGNPTQYEYKAWVAGSRSPLEQTTTNLHWSRVYAWGEGADDGTIFGIPCLEGCYNALLDLEKIRAAAAEGHYKNAKARTVININDDQVAQSLQGEAKKAFDDNVDDFARGFDSMLNTYGMDVQTLNTTLADPQQPFTIALNEIASSEDYPSTILIGQQTGRLASDEDQSHFGQVINSRRDNEISDMITGFLEHLINIGALSPPDNEICIEWPDVTEPTVKDKLELANSMARTNAEDAKGGGSGQVFTTDEIREAAGYESEPKDESGFSGIGTDGYTEGLEGIEEE